MRALENRVFAHGVTSEQLMDLAGAGIATAILRRYPRPGTAVACIGSGNNGGDALVALKYLAEAGWRINVKPAVPVSELRALPRKKWRDLGEVSDAKNLSNVTRPIILLDGLLGIGAKGPLRGPISDAACWMNDTRTTAGADVIAMDIPSGVNGDTGEVYPGAVIADLTLTIGVVKSGLLKARAANHTGSIETVPLDELPAPEDDSPCLNDLHTISGLLSRRPHEFHKGKAGRVGIIAGSRGMLGAAVLCATGALRSGAGLVTLFTDESIYAILAPMLPPEVMVKPVKSLSAVMEERLDALAIGPGIGSLWDDAEFFKLLANFQNPMVLDADALNRIAADGVSKHLKANMILTPHPGEMTRLYPESKGVNPELTASQFINQYPGVTLLLKGAHSIIAQSESPIYFNGSGNAGMASGGQGDVLTGVIGGLLGQGMEPLDAARFGAWLCGRSAELALSHGIESQQSLRASDVLTWISLAFRERM